MSVSETNSEDVKESNIKLELPEDIWAADSSTEITLSPNKLKDIDTLEVKTELFEENCSSASSTATIILPDTKREDTGTIKVKIELPEEGCATVPSTLITSSSDEPKDTSTLDVKLEFTEEEYSTVLSSPKAEQPDTSCIGEETNTFNIKEEISEKHYSTVPTPIFFLPEDLREEYSQLNKRTEFPDQDWSTVPVTTTSLPDLIKEHTRAVNVKVELVEDKIIPSPDKLEDIGTLDIKVEFTEQESLSIPSTQTSLPDTNNGDKEIPEEVSAPVPSTQISSSPDKPEDTDTLDVKVEITQQESSTVLSTPIVSLADTLKGDTRSCNFFSIKNRSSNIQTPIIFLPDDLGEDISKLHNRIEFADQDWSKIPSKPIMSLRRPDSISGIPASANFKKETRQFTAQGSSMKEAQNPKIYSNKFIPQALPMKSTQHNTVLNVPSAYNSSFTGRKLPIQPIKDISQVFPIKTAQSIVPSTPKISLHGHENIPGMSKATSSIEKTNLLLPQTASRTVAVAQSIIPTTVKQSLPVQKNVNVTCNARLPKKLSCKSRKKKAKLIAHGVPEEIASDLCLMPLPEIFAKIPSLKPVLAVLQNSKQESHTSAIDCSKSAATGTAPVGMESELKNPPVNRTVQPSHSSNDTALLRVGIQNSNAMNKEQMTAVHRHLVLVISEVDNDGGGPEFLDFKQMDGWIMVTCVDQRSRAWLIEEVQYLEPWPGAQLSIIPHHKLPQPSVAKVVAYIPESEAANVKEALDLLRAQNKGLNTEKWKILDENLECGKSWTVIFIIDEQSLGIIRAQDCRAAIGFKMMIFKIIPAADISSTNSKPRVPEWQDKNDFKSSSRKTANSSADYVQPVGTGAETNSVESQNLKSQNRHQFVQGKGAVSKGAYYYSGSAHRKSDGDDANTSKEPLSLTEPGRPMPQSVGNTRSAIQDSKSGKILPRDSRQEGPCEDTALITSRENIIYAARVRIEELKQKTQTEKYLSDQNKSGGSGPTSKWDQPPTRYGRQGPLDTRDKNRDRSTIENSKRWREETSMPAGGKRFKATRDSYIDRNGSETRTANRWSNENIVKTQPIARNTKTNVSMAPVVQNNTAKEIGTDLGYLNIGAPSTVTPSIGAPTAVTLSRSGTGGIAVTPQNGVFALPAAESEIPLSSHTIVEMVPPSIVMPSYCPPSMVNMATGGTADITITQQNTTIIPPSIGMPRYFPPNMVNIATGETMAQPNTIMVPPNMAISGYGTPNMVNMATSGTKDITVAQQNTTMVPPNMAIPGYGAPTMVNLAITGADCITVPPQNNVSALPAAWGEVQAMDYFSGPGGSQFMQNQMMFQNSFSYGGAESQQVAQATVPMYPYSNQPYYMNSYQACQNEMSSYQDNSQKSADVVRMSNDSDDSSSSRDGSPTIEGSEEGGYKSWVIQDAESFATSTEHSTLVPDSGPHSPQTKTRYVSPMGEDPNKPSFAQDTNSGAYSDRLYHDSYGSRAYDRDSPVKSDGRSPRARSNNTRNVDDIEDYERNRSAENTCDMDISSRQDSNKSDVKHERSRRATEQKDDRYTTSRQDRSPHVRSSSRDWGVEDTDGDRSRISRNEGDKRDRPFGHERSNYRDRAINSEESESHGRNSRKGAPTDGDTFRSERRPQIRSGYEYRHTQNSSKCHNSSRDRFIRHQPTAGQSARERDGYPRDRERFTRESQSTGHQRDMRRPDVRPWR